MKYIKAIALDLFLFIINFIAIFYAKNVLGRVCLIVATVCWGACTLIHVAKVRK